ncbi:MAG: type VI secretion system lipoprotein TssJ [Gammaproteobacteria bacterium]
MKPLHWFASLFVALTLLAACESKPDPTLLNAVVQATQDANPDASGAASPVVLRYYELKSSAAFDKAQFFDLYEKADTVLAADLLNKGEVALAPGQSKPLELTLNPMTTAVGFVVGYQQIDKAQWRKSMAIVPNKPNKAVVTIGTLALSVK